MLEVREVLLVILVSLTGTISQTLFALFDKCSRPKSLFNEHAFMWKNESGLLLSGIFQVWISAIS